MTRRAVVTALGSAALAGGRPLAAQELQKLRIAGPPVDSYKVVYYAIKAGIFRKYGLEVEPTVVNSGAAGAAALVGGAADIAGVSALTLFQGA